MTRRFFLGGVSALAMAPSSIAPARRVLFYRYRSDGNHVPVRDNFHVKEA